MSRKDYRAFAEALAFAFPYATGPDGREAWRACVRAIADTCKADNGRFDRDRFYDACKHYHPEV